MLMSLFTMTWPERLWRTVQRWALAWGRIFYLGAVVLVLVLSPSSYGPVSRRTLARHIYLDTAPVLIGFTALAALLCVVVTRIVVVAAMSYGLSRYAMEMLIRVLVLELIPLTATLFVAMRCTIPSGAQLGMLPKNNTVTVVTPNSQWNWIPSNIWVGVGQMGKSDVVFRLAPVYAKQGIAYVQAKAVGLHPAGIEGAADSRPAVEVESTAPDRQGESSTLHYDYLVNATGPQLKFGATEGLGPQHGHTVSVCTADHAVEAAARLAETIDRLRAGESQTLVIGMGHGTCTCEGAAFEYVFNVDHELRQAAVRDRARLIYLTNEAELGDFGVGGMMTRSRMTVSGNLVCSRSGPPPCSASARSRPSSGRTSTRSSRAWSTTRPSTARTTPSPSTSRCCCRPSAASHCGPRTGRGTTSRASSSPPRAS